MKSLVRSDIVSQQIETDFNQAIDRLEAQKPKHAGLRRMVKEGRRVPINISNVALEAKRSRTLIATHECRFPKVRERVLGLAHPGTEPRSAAFALAALRAELAESRAQLRLALSEAVCHFHKRKEAERNAARWRAAYERATKERQLPRPSISILQS